MRSSGPIGTGITDLGDTAYTNRAIGTSTDMIAGTQKMDELFGRTSRFRRLGIGAKQLMAGENPFIAGGRKFWGYNEAIEEQIFNDMYTHGRMRATDPRAAAAADNLFENGTRNASAHPGVQQLTVKNLFTNKEVPVGEPNKFMPQQPIHPITATAIKDSQWNALYQRAGGEGLGIDMGTFRDTIVAWSKHDPEVTIHKMRGLENARMLDLEALGGSPYQWAKKLGYETDPFRAVFRFNSLARLRGELELVKAPVNQLMMGLRPGTDLRQWMGKAVDRMMMNPGEWDATVNTTNAIKGVSHMLDITMLQQGGLANMAQSIYIAARGGGRATIKGALDMLTGTDRALVERSGSLFPAALNELTNPTGPMAAFSSGAFRLYGLSMVDRGTRYFAGHVGNQFVKQVERNLLKNPGSKRLQGLIAELGGDPKVLLQSGALPDQMRLSMIQRFANHTSGVTDVRGTPLWASSENPWARLVNKYRTFAVANSAEVRRLIVNAPDVYTAAKRVSTLLAGAYVVGGGINEARKWLHDSLMGNEAKPTKKGLMVHAERLIQGLGTVEGMFVINALRDPNMAVLSAASGPVGGTTASFLQDLASTAKHGVGWRTIDTASKRLPLVGPITGPLVGAEVKRESRRQAETTRQLSGD
jgi:hypothetical protein